MIVNTGSSALATGEIDYHITAGYLSRELTNTGLKENFDENSITYACDNYESPIFTNGKLSYQVARGFGVRWWIIRDSE
ncbi:hypothetical protein OK016_25515 [Vibrio chagasii]|nr:hypothetical protein [Vibrio chagasii]